MCQWSGTIVSFVVLVPSRTYMAHFLQCPALGPARGWFGETLSLWAGPRVVVDISLATACLRMYRVAPATCTRRGIYVASTWHLLRCLSLVATLSVPASALRGRMALASLEVHGVVIGISWTVLLNVL